MCFLGNFHFNRFERGVRQSEALCIHISTSNRDFSTRNSLGEYFFPSTAAMASFSVPFRLPVLQPLVSMYCIKLKTPNKIFGVFCKPKNIAVTFSNGMLVLAGAYPNGAGLPVRLHLNAPTRMEKCSGRIKDKGVRPARCTTKYKMIPHPTFKTME